MPFFQQHVQLPPEPKFTCASCLLAVSFDMHEFAPPRGGQRSGREEGRSTATTHRATRHFSDCIHSNDGPRRCWESHSPAHH